MNITKSVLIGLAFGAAASAGIAETAPYYQDFNGGAATNFTTAGTSGAYTVQAESSGYSYQAALSATVGNQSASSGIPITNLSGASCIISTDFKITSLTANGSSVVNGGLGLFSDTADFSSGSQYRLYYQVTGGNIGKLQLMRNSTLMAVSTATLPPRLNVNYTLSAIISYDAGAITIRGIVYDDSNTISVLAIDNAPFQGTYFGYRTAISTASVPTNISIRYDNLDVSLGNGGQPGDGVITGNLEVGGTVDVSGNSLTLGVSGNTFAAGLFYNPSTSDFSFELTQSDGTWSWRRNSGVGMALDAQNILSLGAEDGVSFGVFLDPNGMSELKSLHVKEVISVGDKIRIPPAGDLSMGSFTAGSNPAP